MFDAGVKATKLCLVGGVAWPAALLPQHTIAPLARKPQLWVLPAAIAVNRSPAGTDVCP